MQLRVKRSQKEAKNSFSIIFQKPDNLQFYPGQYLNISLPVSDPNGSSREFTIASSPSEDFLMITTKKGISNFKKKLQKIKTGQIESDHPAGTFTISENDPAVFLAGGVGITPFRSMIKWALDCKMDLPMTLIYSNSDSDFMFKKELSEWQSKLPNLTIHYINTSKDGRLTKDKLQRLITHHSSLVYYLAGPPAMVDDFEKMLLDLGVDQTSIRTDRFDRY